jgi:bifunctional enzyme CysN/CysC
MALRRESSAARPAPAPMARPERATLRFITCGSVDDGKSTLIGRLLYDSNLILDDQIAALKRDTRNYRADDATPDLSLLVDGLQAEREQGITIDVAYRFFGTGRRKFVVADTPGHEQYTRNMATGASTADLAVILVDARKGLLTQTRRHSVIVSLLGIRTICLAVNKMDLAGYEQSRFEEIERAYLEFAREIGVSDIRAIPVSALRGDNVASRSDRMAWYQGPALLPFLETVEVHAKDESGFRMPVQLVARPTGDFRGYSGMVSGGVIRAGQPIIVLPSRRTSQVARIVTQDGDLAAASSGESVTLTFTDEIDISRGDVIAELDRQPEVSDQFAVHLVWMSDEPMVPGRTYVMQIGTLSVTASVTELKHRLDVNTNSHEAAKHLDLNEIGFCNISLDHAIPFDRYEENRHTGGFILIDRFTNATVAAGMIRFGLRRASNLSWQSLTVDKSARAGIKGQKPCILWFTGLSGAGKSTIANRVEQRLQAIGRHTYLLDGDNVRHGLNKDLGFTAEDRVENIRRVAEAAALFVDAGLIVIVSLISPYRNERQMARERVAAGEFIEVFVDTPLAECERRDPKGLYHKAREGKIPNFTGIDSPYERPEAAEITIDTNTETADAAAERIVARLQADGLI